MRASARIALLGAILTALCLPTAAQASFGFLPGAEGFDASLTEADGSPDTKAGTHPYAMSVHVGLNKAGQLTDGDLRDLHLTLPPSLLANPAAVAECSQALFHTHRTSPYQPSRSGESCPGASQVGVAAVHSGALTRWFGLYNLSAPYGTSEAIGFAPFGIPVVLSAHIREPDAAFVFGLENLPQAFDLGGIDLRLWGTPWEITHDSERGNCLNEEDPLAYFGTPGEISPGAPPSFHPGTCSAGPSPLLEPPKSYLSLPSSCEGPLLWEASADSWQQPATVKTSVEGHDSEGHTLALGNCIEPLTRGKMQLRTESAASATGLVFNLDVNDGGGLLNSGGIVRSQIRRAVVSLPEGLTINPSLGSGLGVCTEADFAREGLGTPPGAGCPNNSKIGAVEVEGLIGLAEPVGGAVYLAKPYDNPQHSLIALYITISSPRRGVFGKASGKVEPDVQTGRLTATFEDLPKLHYTHFALSLREGQRAALISPATCGSYRTDIEMTPWSDPSLHVPDFSIFPIGHGEGGGPCPTGALRPFHPGLEAGSINPNAGSYTPFYLRMTRTDAEQEISSYSATFPPGLTGKLAGIPYCPDAAIEAAKGRSGVEELEHPSCPAASSIGHTTSGYGVGGVLAYAPGALYLAGPYHGAPLSTVAIDSALVGPFDLGTVIVRSAIRIDPRTAQASIDSAGSDPIPHMIKGIPIHLRDIRVYVDRPGFTLNPTSCDPLASLSTLTGAGADLFSAADDVSATSSDRYQLLGCSELGFKPSLSLRGSVRRGDFPSLRAIYAPRPGNANIARATVALPHTEFLAQGHIREICTLHQFGAGACPPSSIYGHAAAFTPLLAEPLRGPVYLRSSATHPLPDMVAALRGPGGIAIDLEGRVDSTKAGGLRASFEVLPDAPVSKFVLTLQGAKKGLLENSANLCAAPSFATARFVGHNNQGEALAVPMQSDCAKRHREAHHHSKHRRH